MSPTSDKPVLSVSELTIRIKSILESQKSLSGICVRGEVSNLTIHSSGHMYFTLKDEISQLSCAFFRRWNSSLKFKVEDGMKVVVSGSIEVHAPHGKYQLIATDVAQDGLGDLHQKFLQLKEKLSEEGLFDAGHKKNIPKFPKTIGIVTSIDGAVLRDIVNIIRIRWPFVNLVISHSSVQGAAASSEIITAMNRLNRLDVDVIIVARGGGSLEDLWCFNKEEVARAIFSSRIPVISAVGHETDFTIADFVADKRASTPSHAAELAVPNKEDILGQLGHYEDRKKRLFDNLLKQYFQELDYEENFMKQIIAYKLDIAKSDLDKLKVRLTDSDPRSILKRGYCIVLKNEKPVISANDVTVGERIKTIMDKGELDSVVEKVRVQ